MAEPEKIPESGIVEESKLFLYDNKVKSYVRSERTTPSGSPIIDITFSDDRTMSLTEPHFDAIKSYQKSDATEARAKLVKKAGQKLYALLMEYGPSIEDSNAILDETVRLTNQAVDMAEAILFGVRDKKEITILHINEVLKKHYDSQHNGKETPTDTPAAS